MPRVGDAEAGSEQEDEGGAKRQRRPEGGARKDHGTIPKAWLSLPTALATPISARTFAASAS